MAAFDDETHDSEAFGESVLTSGSAFNALEELALTRAEIQKALARKVLRVYSIGEIARQFGDYPLNGAWEYLLSKILKDYFVRAAILPSDGCQSLHGFEFMTASLCFFLTDYHLLVGYHGATIVIPLEEISSIELIPSADSDGIETVYSRYSVEHIVDGTVVSKEITGSVGALINAIKSGKVSDEEGELEEEGKAREEKPAGRAHGNNCMSLILTAGDNQFVFNDVIRQHTDADGDMNAASESMIINAKLGVRSTDELNSLFKKRIEAAVSEPAESRTAVITQSDCAVFIRMILFSAIALLGLLIWARLYDFPGEIGHVIRSFGLILSQWSLLLSVGHMLYLGSPRFFQRAVSLVFCLIDELRHSS